MRIVKASLLFALMVSSGALYADVFEEKSVYTETIAPTKITQKGPGRFFVEFPKAAFGTIDITLTGDSGQEVKILFGEKRNADSVVATPGGDVVYREEILKLNPGTHTYRVLVHMKYPSWAKAVQPDPLFSTIPFRYIEVIGSPSPITDSDIKQIAVFYPFDGDASNFSSNDEILNQVWDLCKYSIKACSWLGIYVDGNRERTPYEADAYIEQLGHYCQDTQGYAIARKTQEFLMKKPTWPAEWKFHSVFMAWTEYLWTGDTGFLTKYYSQLKAKTLSRYARADGLISPPGGLGVVGENAHIVDWPGQYRDGYDFKKYNAAVNALYYKSLVTMEKIAGALGKTEDATFYASRAALVYGSFQAAFFDDSRGYYRDGEGSDHHSLHASAYALAVGLVPREKVAGVVEYVKSRGMACSVYGAQYLIEGLYNAEEGQYALDLIANKGSDRSWYNMIKLGSTITTEAWNAPWGAGENGGDWNHAWGSAPANLIPLGLMGVQPLEPGFGKIRVKPQTGNLTNASLKIPTVKGSVYVETAMDPSRYTVTVEIPMKTTAKVYVPKLGTAGATINVDGVDRKGTEEGRFIFIDDVTPGRHTFIRGK